jgi:hypothetical protein
MTADELLRMPRDARYELVAGELIERQAGGALRGIIAANVGSALFDFAKARNLGQVVFGCGFQLAREPDTVLSPGIAYVAAARVQKTPNYFQGAPDLACRIVARGRRAMRGCDRSAIEARKRAHEVRHSRGLDRRGADGW